MSPELRDVLDELKEWAVESKTFLGLIVLGTAIVVLMRLL